MTAYVEPDGRTRAMFLAGAVGLLIAGFLLQLYLRSLPPLSGSPAQLVQVAVNHALATAVFITVLFLCLSAAVIWLAVRTIQSGRWPPLGMRMPFRARIYAAPHRVVVFLIAATFLGLKGAVALLAWQHFIVLKGIAAVVLS
jgi:hypothetical protein